MVVELYYDLIEESSRTGIDPTRCVNCGNFEDAVIRANRVAPLLLSHGQSRAGLAREPRISFRVDTTSHVITKGVVAERLSRSAPLSSRGTPSARLQAFESAQSEQGDSLIPTVSGRV
jgi:hypothetical protein